MAFTVAAKLAVFRTPDGDIWPAFRDRLDPLRATRQAGLRQHFQASSFLRRRALARTLRHLRTWSARCTMEAAPARSVC